MRSYQAFKPVVLRHHLSVILPLARIRHFVKTKVNWTKVSNQSVVLTTFALRSS